MNKFLKFYMSDEGLLEKEVVKFEGHDIPYDMLKEGVGGWIEMVYYADLGSNRLALVVNEEGLLEGLKPTFWLYEKDTMKIMNSPLVGNVLVVGLEGEDLVGITDEEIKGVLKKVMVDSTGKNFFLPVNKEYIEERNAFLNDLFGE